MVWIGGLFSHEWILIQWGVVIVASLAAMLYDIEYRRIPNILTGSMALLGVCFAMAVGGRMGLADAAVACIIMATPCVLLFVFAGGGAGDAKMMGAIGLWLGTVNGVVALAAVTVAGTVWAVGLSLARRRLQTVLAQAVQIAWRPAMLLIGHGRPGEPTDRMEPVTGSGTMPYAVAIFTGVCLAAGGISLWRI